MPDSVIAETRRRTSMEDERVIIDIYDDIMLPLKRANKCL